MAPSDDQPIYDALALPNEAFDHGGIEILRAGIINDELYVSARRAFHDPAQWGEVLADIVQRLGLLYSAETDLTEQEVIGAIESAFAAELGAPLVKSPPRKRASKSARTRAAPAAKSKPRSKTPKSSRASSRPNTGSKPRAKRK